MTTLNYAELVAVAQGLIQDTGRTLTFQRLSAAAADPAKPWKGPGTPTVAESVTGVFGTFVPASGLDFGRDLISDELLKKVDQVVLVAGSANDFENFDQIVDGSDTWRIEFAQTLKPGFVTVLHFFGVCR